MSKIFLSYRRDDSKDVCGRINDALRRSFGPQSVFKDVDSIGGGVDFRRSISDAVSQSRVMLVIIGPSWLTIMDLAGKPRLANPDDVVRLEVELALLSQDMLVIPVLVNGASMPTKAQLPDSLSELAFRNARKVDSDPDFHPHLERLISEIALRIPLASSSHSVVGPGASSLVGTVSPYPPAKRRPTTIAEKVATLFFWIMFLVAMAFIIWVFSMLVPHFISGH